MKTFSYTTFSVFLLSFLLLGLMACEKEEPLPLPGVPATDSLSFDVCVDTTYLSPAELLPESKAYFHHEDIDKAVFINEAGQLATFYNQYESRYWRVNYVDYADCPANPSEFIRYYYLGERISSRFVNDSLKLRLYTELSTDHVWKSYGDSLLYDRLYVSMRLTDSDEIRQSARLVVSQRDLPYDELTYVHYFPELTIMGKVYRDVYTTDDEGEVLFFTKEQGIIAFHDWSGNIWRLEYLE